MRLSIIPKKSGFTLMEMMIAMTIFFLLLTVVTTIFIYIYQTKGSLEARQNLTRESYFLLEKIQTMIKDYTIDYEEYRNRQQVGCMSAGDATRNTGGNCTMMTYYGNKNSVYSSDTDQYGLYYCTNINTASFSDPLVGENGVSLSFPYGCLNDVTGDVSNLSSSGFVQSFGQYQALFTDVREDVDFVPGPVGDDDDIDLGRGPIAIWTGGGYPQELYLISKDQTRRLFLRRKLLTGSDLNGDGSITDSENLYSIQILRLRGFDAGEGHNFDPNTYSGVYDGNIDTWTCDYGMGFVCEGQNIEGAYSGYRLPAHSDDGWQNLLSTDVTISDRNIRITPLADAYLSWADDDMQISPLITISFTSNLYGKNRSSKIPWSQMDTYSLILQTSFSTLP